MPWDFLSCHIWGCISYCNYLALLWLGIMNMPSQKLSLRRPLCGGILAAFICGGTVGDVW